MGVFLDIQSAILASAPLSALRRLAESGTTVKRRLSKVIKKLVPTGRGQAGARNAAPRRPSGLAGTNHAAAAHAGKAEG